MTEKNPVKSIDPAGTKLGMFGEATAREHPIVEMIKIRTITSNLNGDTSKHLFFFFFGGGGADGGGDTTTASFDDDVAGGVGGVGLCI